jgi:NAD+ kinase
VERNLPMGRQIRRALIFVNLIKEDTEALAREVSADLEARGIPVDVEPVREGGVPQVKADTDLAITLGGDGTLLYGARTLAAAGGRGVPILAVNLGDFGFITEIGRQEWKRSLAEYLAGRLGVSRRIMFEVEVRRDGSPLCCSSGLNDAVIRSMDFSRIIRLRIHLAASAVARYRADGVILATPTGSTAYSLSAGGPILHPEMEAFILTPICPFTLSNRPMVVPAREVLEVEVEERQRAGIVLVIDGQENVPLQPRDRVIFRRSDRTTLIVLSDRRNFYEVLASKLNWAGEPSA